MNRLHKTESAVFVYSRFSLFLKDQIFQFIYLSLSHIVLRVTCRYLTLRHLGAILSHQRDAIYMGLADRPMIVEHWMLAGIVMPLLIHLKLSITKNIKKFEESTKKNYSFLNLKQTCTVNLCKAVTLAQCSSAILLT